MKEFEAKGHSVYSDRTIYIDYDGAEGYGVDIDIADDRDNESLSIELSHEDTARLIAWFKELNGE